MLLLLLHRSSDLPASVWQAGWTEYLFRDTEAEVYCEKIEAARINHDGNPALTLPL